MMITFASITDVSANDIFLVLAIGLALAFEFVNGFHDTANAVATVIYTHTLKPSVAVVLSGLLNLTGVLTSGGGVAFGIVSLLPVELVLNVGSGAGFAMVFSLLISAMIWNLSTWYVGLPASSSHTLIGAIIGVGLANSIIAGHSFGAGVNWAKAHEIGLSLVLSPLFGFIVAALLLLLLKAFIRNKTLFEAPEKDKAPPLWIRCILVLTCSGVSYFHGSNDGQKGMGLMVLILVGILPGSYALKMSESPENIQRIAIHARAASATVQKLAPGITVPETELEGTLSGYMKPGGAASPQTYAAIAKANQVIADRLQQIHSFADLPETDRRAVRTDVYLAAGSIGKLLKDKSITDPQERATLTTVRSELDATTKYIPRWVQVSVALALGLGTMIGWKRIVVTVGEKIGKSHLTYAQGASAELVAMGTIGLADGLGLPVSTTHVLSSGVAGTMAANRSGLQMETLRNLLLAWVLTLPVCILLGSALFAFGNYIVLHWLGVK